MWKIKDSIINIFLRIRFWFLRNFKSKKFKNVNNPIKKDGWELTFNDEFDKGELDESKWIDHAYYGLRIHPDSIVNHGEAPLAYMSRKALKFTDSSMKQIIRKDRFMYHYVDWDGKDWGEWEIPYKIGSIDSSRSFEQKFGYFEIRSKVSSEPGGWPAFWLFSNHANSGEIDVYEMYTSRRGSKVFESNFHWSESIDKNAKRKSKVMGHKIPSNNDYHTYAVEWDENGFKIYFDNLLIRRHTNPETIKYFQNPMHIIIGMGVEPQCKGQMSDFPTHEVDYVRAYKKK